jgi:hypothetical protein
MPSNPPVHFATQQGAGTGPSPSDYGYAAWSGDPNSATVAGTGGGGIPGGTLTLRRLSIPGVLSITNLFFNIDVGGTVLTANQCFAGVWDQNGALIGMTADQSGVWNGTGLITMPLAANAALVLPGPPFIVDTPYIYFGYWFNGTTAPFLTRGGFSNVNMMNGPAASVPVTRASLITGNTGLTTVATSPLALNLSTLTKIGLDFWCAVN